MNNAVFQFLSLEKKFLLDHQIKTTRRSSLDVIQLYFSPYNDDDDDSSCILDEVIYFAVINTQAEIVKIFIYTCSEFKSGYSFDFDFHFAWCGNDDYVGWVWYGWWDIMVIFYIFREIFYGFFLIRVFERNLLLRWLFL